MFFINIFLYIIAFIFIWFGAGLIVSSASKFSHKLRLSPFAFSFVFLGILTSIPEFSVGLQAVASQHPEIFVGNLLGGTVFGYQVCYFWKKRNSNGRLYGICCGKYLFVWYLYSFA